jgi:hypothetical protein
MLGTYRNQNQLFVSHDCSNHQLVSQLVKMLRDCEWITWFDNFLVGDNIKTSMKEAIESTIMPLLCVTREYCKKLEAKGNLFYEYELILTLKKQSVVVVMLEKNLVLPAALRDLYYIEVDPNSELSVVKLSAQLHKFRGLRNTQSSIEYSSLLYF